jgi:hypothetical protein
MQEGKMKILTGLNLKNLKGGALITECNGIPEPPPNGAVWLPPNPDNPTANAPMVTSPN